MSAEKKWFSSVKPEKLSEREQTFKDDLTQLMREQIALIKMETKQTRTIMPPAVPKRRTVVRYA